MTPFFALLRKQAGETRWALGISAAALFGLSWLTVYVAHVTESRIRREMASQGAPPPMRFLRGMGGADMDFSTVAIEVAFWNHPFILLPVIVWAIGRGSSAVAREIERGTLDPILSRPVSRTSYLASQITFAVFGLLILGGAMVAGNQAAAQYYPLETPPGPLLVAKPALNLAALGFAIYGATVVFSAIDSAAWRAILIGSVLTLGEFIVHVVANIPVLERWKRIDHLSIFLAYNPVELVTKGQSLGYNVAALSAVALTGIAAAFAAFLVRDLPASA
ncbi:MAG: permease [Isosphaeraceae bacterium]|nr:permease [Isosphaeraceae bacterium]